MKRSVILAASRVRRELAAQAQPAGAFDPARYFRTTGTLVFLNVRTPIVRALGRLIAREHRASWTLADAIAFTDLLMHERALELKGAGIEALAVRRRELTPRSLATFKRWLAGNLAANWATTDTLCGSVISPLLIANPSLVARVTRWSTHPNLWVRRASAVSLVRLAARGLALDEAYDVATSLRDDASDLIHKAAGWLLREAGRTDPRRLERYFLDHGPGIPRTTVRYAIERFRRGKRKALLVATRRSSSKSPNR